MLIMFDIFEIASYKTCFQYEHGIRYVLLVCTDFFACHAKETIYPYLKMKYTERRTAATSDPITIDMRPVFHVESEYMQLLFRQYLIYSTMFHVPMITLFYTVLCIVQILVDRFRLIKICQLPDHHTQVSSTKSYQFLLVLVLIGICLLAALSYAVRFLIQEVYILETCVLPKSILSEEMRNHIQLK